MTKTSKVIIAFLILAVLAVLFFVVTALQNSIEAPLVGSPNSTTTTTVTSDRVRAPEDVSLVVGQTGGTDDFVIEFKGVVSDSRCPSDVTCIQAGWVETSLVISSAGKTSEVVLKSNGQIITFQGYNLSILDVSPNKYSVEEIAEGAYRVKFHIEPAASGANI